MTNLAIAITILICFALIMNYKTNCHYKQMKKLEDIEWQLTKLKDRINSDILE